jgi:hypothetical protein
MSDKRAEILRFWRAVELFNPQAVPRISHDECVEDVKETQISGSSRVASP